MADVLEDLCGRISLTEGEKIGIQVEEGEIAADKEAGGKCLIGKVWTEKNINKEAFRSVLSTVWRTAGGVKFKELRENTWLFEFNDDVDKRRVLDGRPWSFDGQILVLNEFDGNTPPSQLEFNQSPFWIQVHDMPLICMNKNIGTKIGRSLGELEEVDVAGDGMGWGSCLRLRVNIDITKPLDRGRALKLEGKSSWVEFKYEKLPIFCFRCGRIVHGPRGCPIPPPTSRSAAKEFNKWGVELRALDPRRRGARGRHSYREQSTRNSPSESDETDSGRHSGERSPNMATSGFHGNPSKEINSKAPAGSGGGGIRNTEKEAGNGTRKDSATAEVHEISAINTMERPAANSPLKTTGPGSCLGHVGHGHLGSTIAGSRVGEAGGGGNMEDQEVTSMEFLLSGAAEHNGGDGENDSNNFRPTLKTWKRMARNTNNARALTQPSSKTKRDRSDPTDEQNSVPERVEKRSKKETVSQNKKLDSLAAAVPQPRQEP
ncbi:uncharacterized protein LOC132163147 [Corylus avellana]|uniref:uncharacterized protein LOC132163147 n=1 Tax=Corylus avellana TaxID=13451 RepID=UPI00286B3305|nr:uncharacterized protein LOC132163147 [Corylus avellana]